MTVKKIKNRIGFFLITLLMACVHRQVAYQLPDAMREEVKAEYTQICEKGYRLYQVNCGGCHNIGKGRHVKIPDFTPEQIKGYEIRVMNKAHEGSMPDSLVSAEELIWISTFLMYKTPSGISAVSK